MRKYNGEKIISLITVKIAESDFPQQIKEDLMKNIILPTIKEAQDEFLIETTAKLKQLDTLQLFVRNSSILCSPEFIEFAKNYNKWKEK